MTPQQHRPLRSPLTNRTETGSQAIHALMWGDEGTVGSRERRVKKGVGILTSIDESIMVLLICLVGIAFL